MQGSVLVSRKSSSTPSLSEAVEPKLTVASTDQVASAENLTSSSSSEPVSFALLRRPFSSVNGLSSDHFQKSM